MMCRSKTHLSKEALSAIEKQRNVEAVMADNVLLRSILRRCVAELKPPDALCQGVVPTVVVVVRHPPLAAGQRPHAAQHPGRQVAC